MKNILTFILCSALSVSSVALASDDEITFSPSTVKDWVKQSQGPDSFAIKNKRLATLIGSVSGFRDAMSVDADKAIKTYNANISGFNGYTSSQINKKAPSVWRYFFATSIALIGNAHGDSPVSAYYNPYLDTAIYVKWSYDGNEYAPQKMTIDAYEGNNKEVSVPRWLENGAAPITLLKTYQSFRDGFETKYPFNEKRSADIPTSADPSYEREVMEARSLRALLELSMVLRNKNSSPVNEGWKSFTNAVKTGNADKIDGLLPDNNVMSAQQVLDIPKLMRNNMSPAYVLIGDEYSTLYHHVGFATKFGGALTVLNDTSKAQGNEISAYVFYSFDADKQ